MAVETAKPTTPQMDKALAREMLWRRGNLKFLLDANQKELYEMFYTNNLKTHTWLLARRSGKSWALCVIAIETCLRTPGAIVKFLAPTKVQVNLIIRPLMRKILENCPKDLLPAYRKQDGIYAFPNGSEIQLSGSDGGAAERLRGTDSHVCIVDEAGSVNDLSYCVRDILLPATLVTKGKIILASTPPALADHDFLRFIEEAEARGTLVIKTIDDNPRVPEVEKQALIKELGGEKSDATQRELYCKIVKSKDRSVIPEFDEEKQQVLVREWQKPAFYDAYVSMDVGYRDWTVVLFGYYDFLKDKIIIEDEIVAHGQEMFLPKLAQDIADKENQLYTHPITNELIKPYKRVSDHNLIAINEIRKHSGYRINFINAQKDDKHAAINNLRVLIESDKLIINPRCKVLIRHLKNATWASNSTKDTFARCPEGSHYDAVDACLYLVRSIDFRRNPYPKGYGETRASEDQFLMPTNRSHQTNYYGKQLDNVNVYKSLLNIKRR